MEEAQIFRGWWGHAPTDAEGFLSGPAAIPIFQSSCVPPQHFKHIWDIADSTERGRLSEPEFYTVLRCLALCQINPEVQISKPLLAQCTGATLVPTLDGTWRPPAGPSPAQPGGHLPPQPAPAGPAPLPPVSVDEFAWGVTTDDAPLSLDGPGAAETTSHHHHHHHHHHQRQQPPPPTPPQQQQ